MDNNKPETVFLDGFIFKRPHESSPDFVKGNMAIKVDEAIAFLQKHKKADGWVNTDLLVSKDGQKLYFKLNTWEKPADASNPVVATEPAPSAPEGAVAVAQAQEPADIPW
jgi:hypothetical protein